MKPSTFVTLLNTNGIDFFFGVPDSLLANLCAYISQRLPARNHIIAANEGEALAIAAGVYLACDTMSCVYLQNSGQGNVLNPLASLCDQEVYGIPVLMVIGWRGEPGQKDEPQHVKQGRITLDLNRVLGVPTCVVEREAEMQTIAAIEALVQQAKRESRPVALVVPRGFFDKEDDLTPANEHTLVRQDIIELVIGLFRDAAIISTTGKISRELYQAREQYKLGHAHDFLTVGSMGHASSIALGAALIKPDLEVVCLDGDGAALMHMGALAVNACYGPSNFKHIVLNNEAHESVGCQPTIAGKVSLTEIAKSCGYRTRPAVRDAKDLESALAWISNAEGPAFLEIFVALGSRADLGRPKETPVANKHAFMRYLRES